MPIYVYTCTKCNKEEERRRDSFDAQPYRICPWCGAKSVKAFFPTAFVVSDKPAKKKLTGWRKSVW